MFLCVLGICGEGGEGGGGGVGGRDGVISGWRWGHCIGILEVEKVHGDVLVEVRLYFCF